MKTILIIMGRYLPGYKDGGPVRSIKNLVDALGDEYDFRILTNDRDHGDLNPYSNIKYNEWNDVGKAKVWYVPPKGFSCSLLEKLANLSNMVYVCGCFDDYSIKLLLLNRLDKIHVPVVIASMGLFSPKAFELKNSKKKLFVNVFRKLGCFSDVVWSVTSELEKLELQNVIGKDADCRIVQDLPRQVVKQEFIKNKEINALKVCFISRISRKKNLSLAIRILQNVKSNVRFDIYGPKEDVTYWEECQKLLEKLPSNIHWNYCGIVDSENVVKTFSKYQIFLFPTLGENYGHVIHEALSGGCLCLISDQTPWQDFEKENIGAVYPLEKIGSFAEKIEEFAKMETKEFQMYSNRAVEYAEKHSKNATLLNNYRCMFDNKSILFLTNIPSPYRVDFFNLLGRKMDLTVVFDGSYNEYREESWLKRNKPEFDAVFLKKGEDWKKTLRSLLHNKQYSNVVVGTYTTPSGRYSIQYMIRHRIPFAISVDGGLVPDRENPIKKFLKKYYISAAHYWLSSGRETDKYLLYYGAKADRIYHYPFTSVFDADIRVTPVHQEEIIKIRSQLNIKEQVVFLAVGQFIERKGFDLLINVAIRVDHSVGFFFIGGEPTDEYINMSAGKENIHFIGFLNKDELNQYYDASDYFVLPTREDIWGLVVNEAMSRGLPVLTTNRCIAGCELVEDNVNGWIIPVDDLAALENAVNSAIALKDQPDKYNSFCQNAINMAKKYSFETMVDAHIDVFSEERR